MCSDSIVPAARASSSNRWISDSFLVCMPVMTLMATRRPVPECRPS